MERDGHLVGIVLPQKTFKRKLSLMAYTFTGRRESKDYRFVSPYINLKPADKISLNPRSELLWHGGESKRQHVMTLNSDITPERGVGERMVWHGGDANLYLSYRQAVRKGLDAFIILGDPNAEALQKRAVAEIVLPLR